MKKCGLGHNGHEVDALRGRERSLNQPSLGWSTKNRCEQSPWSPYIVGTWNYLLDWSRADGSDLTLRHILLKQVKQGI